MVVVRMDRDNAESGLDIGLGHVAPKWATLKAGIVELRNDGTTENHPKS